MIPAEVIDQVRRELAEGRDAQDVAGTFDDYLRDREDDYAMGMLQALRTYVAEAMEHPAEWGDPEVNARRVEEAVTSMFEGLSADPVGSILVAEYCLMVEFMDWEFIGEACALVASEVA